ncbi:MAG: hydantoinase/oxoprolinase family protein [Chloroflexi bacterium]|nr:hydantoinase/oxoprolinase family protein [Chloroflexota bacterium]
MRIGVDIGGTFTDVVVFDDDDGSVRLAKSPSTPGDLARGVREALGRSGVPLHEAQSVIHGSTVVINAVIERTGAKTALLTTRGFRDVYEIGRINRPESFNPRFRKHRPLVARENIFEIPERILADGSVRLPLDEAAVREVARILRDEQFESIAILFLHSYRSPQHELRARQILLEECPDWFVSASHELSREYREYERTSTVAANAYVGPIVSAYLNGLERNLHADGFAGDVLIMQSNGGLSDLALARQQCIQMLESGPAGGVVGTMAFCETLNVEHAIAFDMGGTTAKACVVMRGEPSLSPDYFIGGYNEGLAIRIPVLDIVEVGTGGGSVAWLDEGNALHVGPRSAGADPGPAAYGHGGDEPTLTDANVVLGRLAPDAFLGGEMQLDLEAAARSLRTRVAAKLEVDLERAAAGMLEVATSSMANVVRMVTLQRGLDPRDFTLFAYGGGGPLHASAVARELAISTVVVPQAPGLFSALGMLLADLRRDYVQTLFVRLDSVAPSDLEAEYRRLEDEGRRALGLSGIPVDRVVFERAADMRYVGQEHAVTVRMPACVADEGSRDSRDSREAMKRLFDAAHQQHYSHSAADEPADVVSLRVTAIGRLAKPSPGVIPSGSAEPAKEARKADRLVTFDGDRGIFAAVYDRSRLLAGNAISGPAVIEEDASTTLVWPDDVASINRFGHIMVRIGGLPQG